MKRSGFAKDNIKDLGKLTRAGTEALIAGDLPKLGKIMDQQQNILTILGVYPKELKPLVEAAKKDSYGVTLTGTNGDAIIAISETPEIVASNIKKAGGEAIITKIGNHGLEIKS